MKITIARFGKNDALQWNEFLGNTKNELFLFHRSYMEYHEDRFVDHSLLIYVEDKLKALFPANESDQQIFSHAGLTFGGLLYNIDLKGNETVAVLKAVVDYYQQYGFVALYYKSIPNIFHKYPCQEDLYALFRNKANLYRRDISSVVALAEPIRFSESKRQSITKCTKASVEVLENQQFDEYWQLLETTLAKFEVKPVHTLAEIQLLKKRFPTQIRLFEARLNNELLAGIVVYDYNKVVHTQYMANAAKGRTMGALDYINATLIGGEFSNRGYYSFGISTEDGGKLLNEGLIQQKEMMGGRAIVHDFYKIDL